MLHRVINYEHVSIAFAIIIGVALQEHKEYNNLTTLLMLPWWSWQKWSIHVGN